MLNDCLHLCNLAALIEERPLLAWSSGCMAVSERIVVIDDDDPAGRPGGALRHRHRCRSRDGGAARRRVTSARTRPGSTWPMLARRCAPSVCVLLDPGDRLELHSGRPADLGSVGVIAEDGRVHRGAQAA